MISRELLYGIPLPSIRSHHLSVVNGLILENLETATDPTSFAMRFFFEVEEQLRFLSRIEQSSALATVTRNTPLPCVGYVCSACFSWFDFGLSTYHRIPQQLNLSGKESLMARVFHLLDRKL